MFDNIGKKIKALAQAVCCIGIIFSVISGIVIMVNEEDLILLGIVIILLGSLLSWVSSFTLYGFGEAINQLEYSNNISKEILKLLKPKNNDTPVRNSPYVEKIIAVCKSQKPLRIGTF